MYNVRYHIASLVAVFLALALGLVLGGLVVQRGSFDRQQGALVDGLRNEFASLRTENRELAAERDLLSTYSAGMTDSWAGERLVGDTVIILTNAGRDDGLRAARQAIESAGGDVAVVTMTRAGFGLDDEAVRETLGYGDLGGDALQASVVTSLAAEWASAETTRPLTASLVEAGVLVVNDFDIDRAAAGIVDIASPDGTSDPSAVQLAVELQGLGVPAVGAQTGALDTGKAAAAAQAEIAAIDTLGTVVGRYSLIALLTGAEGGYYGVAPAAQAPYPQVSQ